MFDFIQTLRSTPISLLLTASLAVTVPGCGVGGRMDEGPAEGEPGGPEQDIFEDECPFSIPEEVRSRTRCYRLQREGSLSIPVTVVEHHGPVTEAPIVLQNGGPGASPWLELGALTASEFGRTLNRDHDLVIVETRGGRFATPALHCPGVHRAHQAALEDPTVEDTTVHELAECYRQWRLEATKIEDFDGVDLTDDIVAAIDALDYDTFNYFGTSFGTIIAQHLMRDYAGRLEKLVLDSPVLLGTDYMAARPQNAEAALKVVDASCRRDPACHAQFGDVRALVHKTLRALDRKPAKVQTAGSAGNETPLFIDGDMMAGLIHQALYNREIATYIPLLTAGVYEAEIGSALAELMTSLGNLDEHGEHTYFGQSFASHCAQLRGLPKLPSDEDNLEFGARIGASIDPLCELFDIDALPDALRQPHTSDLPILLLAGEHDPVTPAKWTEEFTELFPNSQRVVIAGQGHGVIASECGSQSILKFMAEELEGLGDCANDHPLEIIVP